MQNNLLRNINDNDDKNKKKKKKKKKMLKNMGENILGGNFPGGN